MARVNVDDAILIDPRFMALVEIIGNKREAIGMLVELWKLGVFYWGRGKHLIPKKIFKAGGFLPCLEADLVEERDSGFYCKGSEERFGWYFNRCNQNQRGKKLAVDPRPVDGGPTASPSLLFTLCSSNNLEYKIKSVSDETNPPDFSKFIWFQELWNEKCGALGKCTKLTPKRLKSLKLRLKENPTKEYWASVFDKIMSSDFLTGKNDREWKASIDWIIKPDISVKVLEGAYSKPSGDIKKQLDFSWMDKYESK